MEIGSISPGPLDKIKTKSFDLRIAFTERFLNKNEFDSCVAFVCTS